MSVTQIPPELISAPPAGRLFLLRPLWSFDSTIHLLQAESAPTSTPSCIQHSLPEHQKVNSSWGINCMLALAKRIWPILFSFFQILITDSAACVPYKCGTVSKRNKQAFQQCNSETIRYFQNAAARKSIGDIGRLTRLNRSQ